MTDSWASTASRMKVLTDRDEEWNLRMEMIRRAERFILLTTYYFGSDERSGTMADALAAAARRGVRVVLVVDSFGHRLSRNLSKASERPKLAERLRAIDAAGGLVVSYKPSSLRHRLVGGGAHIKIQVSEKGVAVFGSSNIARQSFSHWNEASLELEGAIVALLVQEACRLARLGDDETAALTDLLPSKWADEPRLAVRYVREDPASRSGGLFPFGAVSNRLTDQLVAFIDRAERSLAISSLYCKPASALKDALVRACRRGVDVELFHSHRDSLGVTHIPWIPASFHSGSIQKEGARVYENRAGEHSKVLLVDDREVAIGSYNLEHAAHDRLVEAMIFTDDVATCDRFRTMFETLRRSAGNPALTPGWLRELPLNLQVKRWLFRPLERWI